MNFLKCISFTICVVFLGMFVFAGTTAAQNNVTLYDQTNFQGQSEAFTADDQNLADNAIGNKTLWSIRVPAGCQVVLYELDHYRGDAETFRADDPNLGDNMVENEYIRSIRVSCRGSRSVQQLGVKLFESPGFSGQQEFFAVDDSDLKDNLPGRTPVGSLQLSPGCQAILYERENFQGDEEKFTANDADLRDNMVEYEFIRSMRVSCPSSGAARSASPAGTPQNSSSVILYSKENYKGTQEAFNASDPNLNDNLIGNDNVSSVVVPKGCRVKLYEKASYKGTSVQLRHTMSTLKKTELGNDEASSLEVYCE